MNTGEMRPCQNLPLQKTPLPTSDWRYVGSGWTDYRSGPAAETFGEGDIAGLRKGLELGGSRATILARSVV